MYDYRSTLNSAIIGTIDGKDALKMLKNAVKEIALIDEEMEPIVYTYLGDDCLDYMAKNMEHISDFSTLHSKLISQVAFDGGFKNFNTILVNEVEPKTNVFLDYLEDATSQLCCYSQSIKMHE